MSLSVVITLFNKEKYIAATIKSVLKQSYADYELVIIDDGSTDKSVKIVQSFSDPRIRLIQQANQGVSKARNIGVEKAKNSVISFLDGDDEWKENFLETIVALINKYPEAGIYGVSYFTRFNQENRITTHKNDLKEGWEGIINDYVEYFHKRIAIHSSSFAIKKEAFYSVGGFRVGDIMSEDLLFVLQVLYKNKLAYKNICCVYYNQGFDGQVTSRQFEYSKDSLMNGIRRMLATEKGLTTEDRKVLKTVFDTRLRHLFQFNISNGNGIDRKYSKQFLMAKGRAYSTLLLMLSFLPAKSLLRLYSLFRKIKRKVGH
jgi:Glycosyltransferases involved in cell wall biogenesis